MADKSYMAHATSLLGLESRRAFRATSLPDSDPKLYSDFGSDLGLKFFKNIKSEPNMSPARARCAARVEVARIKSE